MFVVIIFIESYELYGVYFGSVIVKDGFFYLFYIGNIKKFDDFCDVK